MPHWLLVLSYWCLINFCQSSTSIHYKIVMGLENNGCGVQEQILVLYVMFLTLRFHPHPQFSEMNGTGLTSDSCASEKLFFTLWVFKTWTVLPAISFSRSKSWFLSSIFSMYCWFSILSWLKSTSWRTSPISSFCDARKNKNTERFAGQKTPIYIEILYTRIDKTCCMKSCVRSFTDLPQLKL